jgi:peptidoglycan hydrolase-like protein with peptidoglycan-binding domain
MRSFTTSLSLAVGFVAALCVLVPFFPAQAAPGQVRATILDEVRLPIVDATIEVTCDGSTYASLGTTSATGTVVGDPTIGTTCINGSPLLFRVSSSTFVTQRYPVVGYTLLPYYTSVDPGDASSTISGSTNVFAFGVETTSTYAMSVWNADGDASFLPFPTGIPDHTFTSSTLAFDWGNNTSPYAGINATDWFVEATKTVTLDTGWYEFDLASDDGTILTLDGTTLINNYDLQPLPSRPKVKRVHVSAGVHTINIKYYEHDGFAALYFSFYPIEAPNAPVIEIGSRVSSPLNNRLVPSLGLHTDTAGSVTFGGSCTSTDSITIGVGTSTVSMDSLPNGTYNDCTLTVTDPDTTYATQIAIPSFTVATPIPIHLTTCAELQAIDATSTNYAEDFILDNDIDCDGVPVAPLDWSQAYIGTFDGNGYTIENFEMVSLGSYDGLFSEINGGTVKDLNIGPGLIQGGMSAGAIAGYATDITLTNVSSSLAVSADPGMLGAGGLIGQVTLSDGEEINWSNVTVHNSAIQGWRYVGGLVGRLDISSSSTLSVSNAHVTGDMSPSMFFPFSQYQGGLFGMVGLNSTSSLSITHSSVSSTLDLGSSGSYGGGFIGSLGASTYGPVSLTISHSSSSGSLSGGQILGGFIGNLSTSDGGSAHTIDISNNQTSMAVTGRTTNIGGFIGRLDNTFTSAVYSTISLDSNSASGDVIGGGNVGGFLGGSSGSGAGTTIQHAQGTGGLTITNSSSSGDVTGNTLSDNASNAGGFVGYLSCKSENDTQFAACSLRQNSASGNVSGYRYVGGFMGQLDGDINLEDIYSTGNVTGARDTGGLLGALNSSLSYANLSRAYASSTVTTSGGSPSNVAGLIGSVQSSNSNTTIDHVFAIAGLSDPSASARLGWMIGTLSGVTPTDLAYSPVSGSATACVQSTESINCTGRTDITSFYTTTSTPMDSWDFSDVWQDHASTYPTLRFSSITTDTEDPTISYITALPSIDSAQIDWTTNEPASSNIAYSTDSSYSSSAGISDTSPRTLRHRATITRLLPCQAYNFRAISADRYGNTRTSAGSTFTTLGCGGGGSASRGSAGGGGGGGGGSMGVSDWIVITPVQNLLASSSSSSVSTTQASLPVIDTPPIQPVSSPAGPSLPARQCFNYTFTKDLKLGASSPDVKQLQIFLNRNAAPIALSGPGALGNETTYFGPSTKRALATFQRARQLRSDGNFTSATRALVQSLMQPVACPVAQAFTRNLRSGMSGSDVRTLQRFLKVSETSFFGPATKKALQAFQKGRALPTTGTLDTTTRALLNTLVKV